MLIRRHFLLGCQHFGKLNKSIVFMLTISFMTLISGIKLEKSVLLFPMFDNMSLMPKAANLRTMLNWQGYIVGIAWLTGIFPTQLKNRMIQFYSSKFSKNIFCFIGLDSKPCCAAHFLTNQVTGIQHRHMPNTKLHIYAIYFPTFDKADCTIFALSVGRCHH